MAPDQPHPIAITHCETLADTLAARAGCTAAGVTAIDEFGDRTSASWHAIAHRASLRGGWLRERGVLAGDPVVIALPNDLRFLDAFFGCWAVGAIPVPMAPPHLFGAPTAERAAHVVADVGATLILAAPEDIETFSGFGARAHGLDLEDTGTTACWHPAGPDDTALIQYTSGSTARPRGVMLSHANLLANCSGLTAGDDWGDAERVCGWLPLYHDLGLISQLLLSLHLGLPYYLIEPSTFLMNPLAWLQTVDTDRCTLTHAPNFALGHAVRRIAPDDRSRLDLSCLKRLVLGGEPISVAKVEQFLEVFAPSGLSPKVILAAYGLAESVVGVTRSDSGAGLHVDRVDPIALADGHARPSDAATATAVPSVGRSLPGHTMCVVDADGAVLADRRVGRVLCIGPSLMQGYWRQPEASAAAFLTQEDGIQWLDTGDLGYVVDGALYICGRAKELIIVRGSNYHPHDIERLAEQVDGVRNGQAVAFGVQTDDGEVAVLVTESMAPKAEHPAIIAAVRRAVLSGMGLKLRDVVLNPRGTTPKTTSGKRQRLRVRRAYEAARGAQ